MFVPHSEVFNSIKIWAVEIVELILFLSVLIAIVVKHWRLLRDFLKANDSKHETKIKQEAEK